MGITSPAFSPSPLDGGPSGFEGVVGVLVGRQGGRFGTAFSPSPSASGLRPSKELWGFGQVSYVRPAARPTPPERKRRGRWDGRPPWTCSEIEAHGGSGEGPSFARVDLFGVILSREAEGSCACSSQGWTRGGRIPKAGWRSLVCHSPWSVAR